MTRPRGVSVSVRRCVALAVPSVFLAVAALAQDPPDFRVVAMMHQNLAAIDQIQEAVIRDDYPRVARGAATLQENAKSLAKIDLASIGLDPAKDFSFDRYLDAQTRAATAIAKAGGARDAGAVLLGVKALFDDACVACHADFRESDEGRTPPVLFMRSLLSSVQSVNRGVVTDDFARVAREAREIGAIAHILTWTQVIESMFAVEDPVEQAKFRSHFQTLSTEAILVERAATERDSRLISEAAQRMLQEGCVRCHDEFRAQIRERARRSRGAGDRG